VTIDKSVTIIGADSGETFIDGDNQGSVFTIGEPNPNIDVELDALTIRGGSNDFGGGIKNFGRLALFDIAITENNVSHSGGGIFNNGSTTCTSVGITNNSAGLGAGIFNDVSSDLVLNSVDIESNRARARGGGIFNKGNMHFGGGTVYWNAPDNIVDDTALQPAGDLGSPAVDLCGPNRGPCVRGTYKNNPRCPICAGDTFNA
jgi:hypothetical protein